MRKKVIVAGIVGALGVGSILLGTATFASTAQTGRMMGYGSGAGIMRDHDRFMDKFASPGDAEAFRTAVGAAIKAKDYTGFVKAHTTYGITIEMTQNQFEEMAANSLELEELHTSIKKAITEGDYAARKKLNANSPLVSKIDTEAKFTRYQEMYTYQEKARTIGEELGIQGPQGDGMGMGHGRKGMGQGRGMRMGTQNTTTSQ